MQAGALRFGEFKLKSGRPSPYFFNSGAFSDGDSLARLGRFYARAVQASGLEFDMVFGPAYKGIPLAASVAIACAELYNRRLPYCFDRKEEKDHGEGGLLLGAEPRGRVLIVDDVITAGASIAHAARLIRARGAEPVAVAVALDRQERGRDGASAVAEARERHGLALIRLICLDDLIRFLQDDPGLERELQRVRDYRQRYGAA